LEQALKGKVWVNIIDLVDHQRMGEQLKFHGTEGELRDYTKETKKIFSKEQAKENGFLTALLITL
jgi:hypothetical protein